MPKLRITTRKVTAVILENQEKALAEDRATLEETQPVNATGTGISNWDSNPNLTSSKNLCQISLLTTFAVSTNDWPTGLIFAMKARYQDYPSGNRLAQSEIWA